MSLGEKLLNLRKDNKLSQEELAEKLNVTRQTISKWETDQSLPDFDKIKPLCALYDITPNELFNVIEENKKEKIMPQDSSNANKTKKARGIALAIILYFVAIVWIMISVPVMRSDPIVSSAFFLLICGIATGIIVYVCMVYKKDKEPKKITQTDKIRMQISSVVAIIVLIIYLIISFMTMAWHLTWIIWIIYGLFDEVLKLIFMLKELKDEE